MIAGLFNDLFRPHGAWPDLLAVVPAINRWAIFPRPYGAFQLKSSSGLVTYRFDGPADAVDHPCPWQLPSELCQQNTAGRAGPNDPRARTKAGAHIVAWPSPHSVMALSGHSSGRGLKGAGSLLRPESFATWRAQRVGQPAPYGGESAAPQTSHHLQLRLPPASKACGRCESAACSLPRRQR